MKYFIMLLFICLITSGCKYFHGDLGGVKPSSFHMDPPPGPPEYQQGYTDGCESGFSGYSNSFNKMFWTWKQDPELAQNPVYYKIWKDAYSYCANWAMMVDEHAFGNWR